MDDQEAFVNRLRKMARHHGKWARRQGITCYRIFDSDLPSHPLAIDRYENWVHVAEYTRDLEMDEMAYRGWRWSVRRAISEVLEVPNESIFFKERTPQKGTAQYEKRSGTGREREVHEGGLTFLINLEDYLDTGLFLDHRQTRSMVRDLAMGKRFLNLFGYTGSFTIYAAAGGCRASLTLDLSNTYLDWARRNLAVNHLDGPDHEFRKEDVLAWLRAPVPNQWDLIVMDPPTFSNSKMMRDILDIQRDHPWMLDAAVRRLARGGTLFFSTNHRRFRLDTSSLPDTVSVRDISPQTVPPDFRNRKIHQCWRIDKAG